MRELQTKGYIENLNVLFKRLDFISRIELIPNKTNLNIDSFSCCVQYKPGKMKAAVKIQTPDNEEVTIPLTELSSIEFLNGKTTISGTNYDIY